MPLYPNQFRKGLFTGLPFSGSIGALGVGATFPLIVGSANSAYVLHSILIRVTNAGEFKLECPATFPILDVFMQTNESKQYFFPDSGLLTATGQTILIRNQSSAASDISVCLFASLYTIP